MGIHLTVGDIPAILAVVVAITEVVKKYAIPPDYAPLIAAVVALVAILAWAATNEPAWTRAMIWPYFAGWVGIWTGAMGTHSVITHVTSRTVKKAR